MTAGYYRPTEPFPEQSPYSGVRAWGMVDMLFETSLRILVLDPSNPSTSEVLDTARRSSLIDDPHVIHITPIGENPATHYVATKAPLGTPPSAYLHGAPFSPDRTQVLTDEVVGALNSAWARGVRYLQFTPQHIRVGVLDEVFIDGLGVEATLVNLRAGPMSSSQVDRMKSRGITALLVRLLAGGGKSKTDAVLRSAAENGSLPEALRSVYVRELRGLNTLSPADLVREPVPWGAVEPLGLPSTSASNKTALPAAEPVAVKDSSDHAPAEVGVDQGDRRGEPSVIGPTASGETGSVRGDIGPLSDESVKSSGMESKWLSLGTLVEEHPKTVDPLITVIFHSEDFGDVSEGDYVSITGSPEDEVSEDKTIETAATRDGETVESKKTPQSEKAPQGKKKIRGGKKKSTQGRKKTGGGNVAVAQQIKLPQTQVELP